MNTKHNLNGRPFESDLGHSREANNDGAAVSRSVAEMTLRDHFAAMALRGVIGPSSRLADQWDPWIAKRAYALADEMLKARNQV